MVLSQYVKIKESPKTPCQGKNIENKINKDSEGHLLIKLTALRKKIGQISLFCN